MAKPWSTDEEDILKAAAPLGVKGVQEALEGAGWWRPQAAIRVHASRLGVSLAPKAACPRCGYLVDHLTPSGWCEECAINIKRAKARERQAKHRAKCANSVNVEKNETSPHRGRGVK